jgi:hypothetical protein
LKQAIQKYGKESFKKVILESCSSLDQLKEREVYWINLYKACEDNQSYNIASGGSGGDTFTFNPNKELIRAKLQARRHTESTKAKISKNNWQKFNAGSRAGQKWSEEQRRRMEEYFEKNGGHRKGSKQTDLTKEKIRKSKIGSTLSEATKSKISAALKGSSKKQCICPHCGKRGGGGAMKQWHFDNCKNKT